MSPRKHAPLASIWISLGVVAVIGLSACSKPAPQPAPERTANTAPAKHATVTKASFGALPDGTAIDLYTLTNAGGLEVRVISYGGIIVSLKTPDRDGKLDDIALGYASIDGYVNNPPYFGAIIGRYANRIGNARFELDGRRYRLPANDGPNTLHGGIKGFDKAVWHTESFEQPGAVGIVLTHTSADGDEGFPGALSLRVTYTLNDRNELAFDYHGTTDKPTVVNLTQHTYFNLAGDGSGDVLGHQLTINADRYTPVDAKLIPLGELANVAGTPLDFRNKSAVGARIDSDHPQLQLGKGYDHNYVLNRSPSEPDNSLVLAARVEEPKSGRVMEVRTTEPGMQFYSGNFLDAAGNGKSGRSYQRRDGFCLETQHFPDSPNRPQFPATTLLPGQEYSSRTIYSFSTL